MSDTSLGAHPISGTDVPSRKFRSGRVCRHLDCQTRLSIYNDGSYCYQHEPMTVPRVRGKKIA